MELRSYLAIIRRRIWIVALVVGVIALYVVYEGNHLRTTPGALRGYTSDVTLRFGFSSTAPGNNQNSNDTASEALADAFTTGPVLTSKEFMAQVVQQVQLDTDQITQKFGANPDLGNLQDSDTMSKSLSATHTHNLVTITVNWSTLTGAWAIANASSEITTAHLNHYLGYTIDSSNSASSAAAQMISAPTDPKATTGTAFSRVILLVVLLLAALIIGLALAFLIEYLDERIRSQEEVIRLLQLPSYGTVPRAPMPGGSRSRSSTAT